MATILAAAAASSDAQTPKSSSTSTASKKAAGPAKPAAAATGLVFKNDDEKIIYALGLSISNSISQFHLTPRELELVKRALTDAAAGKPAEDIAAWGPKIGPLAKARATAVASAFLTKAAAEPGAVKTESGLIYKEITPGTGPSPAATDTVKVNYRGTFVDGKEFDSSYSRNQPAEFPLSNVIKCWTEGVQKMKVGGKAKLVCPASIAYGEQGSRGMPPGATLIFEIELLGITGKSTPQ